MLLFARSGSVTAILTAVTVSATFAMTGPLAAADKPVKRVATASREATDSAAARQPDSNDPTVAALRIVRSVARSLEAVNDYEATFTKRERIGTRLIHQSMQMKVRHKPFSVYLKYLTDHPGREVLYVHGRNGNRLQVHEGEGLTSLVGTISLDPNGAMAMEENRYPITQIGMRRLVNMLIEAWEKEARYGETDVRFYPNAKLGETRCKVIEWSHPVQREHFPYQKCRLYIDRTTNLPVRFENFGWPGEGNTRPRLLEEYTYTNVRTNVGLSDADFDPGNTAYAF
ncbi:DUF1571 domain-containing protein [Maioricimonas sp. JC845]|uniref:DUF1571 domain-containing protein n=1 Tax=Maioricimonas sp. JC845 TaxID=3232138 RepID=UPI003458E69A